MGSETVPPRVAGFVLSGFGLLAGVWLLSSPLRADSVAASPVPPPPPKATAASAADTSTLPAGRLNFNASSAIPSTLSIMPTLSGVPAGSGATARVPLPADADARAMIEGLDNSNLLGPGDRITYQVLEDRDDARPLTVNTLGEVDIPYLGRVNVSNKTPKQLAVSLKAALEKDLYFRATPIILVDEISRSRGAFYLYGQVKSAGQQVIPAGSGVRMSRAILNAGGLTEDADRTRVTILRTIGGKETTLNINLDDVLSKPNSDADLLLQAEDVVTIPVLPNIRRAKVLVYGRVNSPGEFDLPNGEPLTVSRAILKAGGFSGFADRRKVRIYRRKPNSDDRDEIVVDVLEILEKGRDDLDVALQPDDHVMVMQKGINF